jgi:ribokinase
MIVCLGDAALDVVVRPDGGVLHGSDVAGSVRIVPGGSAANVAVWAARLGAVAAFIGAVGDDPAGAWLREDLWREGVQAHLPIVGAPTAAVAALVDGEGERAMIADRGAAAALAPEHVEQAYVPPGCRLHLPAYSLFGEPMASASLRAVRYCREAGGSVAIDSSSVGPLAAYGRERFLRLVAEIAPNVLFVNADEGSYLSGCAAAADGVRLLRRLARLVVWKQGADGALALGDNLVRAPGTRVEVVDSTGAGDAFAAAFTVATLGGASVRSALERGNALAARVVGRLGARPALDAR